MKIDFFVDLIEMSSPYLHRSLEDVDEHLEVFRSLGEVADEVVDDCI